MTRKSTAVENEERNSETLRTGSFAVTKSKPLTFPFWIVTEIPNNYEPLRVDDKSEFGYTISAER